MHSLILNLTSGHNFEFVFATWPLEGYDNMTPMNAKIGNKQ